LEVHTLLPINYVFFFLFFSKKRVRCSVLP
jgi:hypothetical protein